MEECAEWQTLSERTIYGPFISELVGSQAVQKVAVRDGFYPYIVQLQSMTAIYFVSQI